MRNNSIIGLTPNESYVTPANIRAPFFFYRMHGLGNQADWGAQAQTLIQNGTAAAQTTGLLLDPDTDTYYTSTASDSYIDAILNMQNWAVGGACVLCFDLVIPTTPSGVGGLFTYGIINSSGGWHIRCLTSRRLSLQYRGVGSSSNTTVDPQSANMTANTRLSIAVELYLETATTLGQTVYVDGVSTGSTTGSDLRANGASAIPGGGGVTEATFCSQRTGTSGYGNILGSRGAFEVGHIFGTYLPTRNTALAQDLSAWFHKNQGELPRPMVGS